MPEWGWILVAVLVVIALAATVIAARATASRRRTVRLKEQFGPEYQRAVGEAGDQRAAENELMAREREHSKLDIVPLSPETHERYAEDWRVVQTAFVDDPSSAVGRADRLVTQVMRERGYPIDDFDQRAADISVDHPDVVENYRIAHGIHLSQERVDVGTERKREAFVHYRALFDKLLETESDKTKEAKA
jgi:hypothetical protein